MPNSTNSAPIDIGDYTRRLLDGAAGIQPATDRDMEEVPSLEPQQGMDCLSLLPEDVQRMVLGFLDLPTLYTARLVCKRVRKLGAGHVKALDCPTLEGLLTTDLTQFSSVKHLAVTVSHESQLEALADPRIALGVTQVSLNGFRLQNGRTTEVFEGVLMRLPVLRSVSLQPADFLRLPLFPSRLEELKITERYSNVQNGPWACVGDAASLTRCSQLTSLVIDLGPTTTSLETLSSLRNLRSLDLHSRSSALRFLSTLTALTSLTFEQRSQWNDGSVYQDIGRLTGLSQLALSRILTPPGGVMHEDLTCIAQLNNLTCLDMSGCDLADSLAASTALLPLTRLAAVRFRAYMPQLSGPQVGALHSLTLHDVSDASLLLTASMLTHLDLFSTSPTFLSGLPGGLCPAIARMSSLRSLILVVGDRNLVNRTDGSAFQLDAVLRACTMLTKLDYKKGHFRPDRDQKACAALPGLRSLSFRLIHGLTPARLPALQAMSGLTELSLIGTEIRAADMTPDVIKAFDAKRHELGWPLLKLYVEDCRGRRFVRLGH